MSRPRYYPLFVDLTGRRCVVVGGGMIAQRKALGLLRAGASVTVVSPTVTRGLQTAARQGRLRYLSRAVRRDDFRGAWLITSATDDPAINTRAARAATSLGIFANVVDQPRLCSFIAPSIYRRGALTVAFSTGGRSPLLAKRLRQDLARIASPKQARMLRFVEALRPKVHDQLSHPEARKRYFKCLFDGPVF